MANYTIERVDCPHCGKSMKIKTYEHIEASSNPKLKDQIIHGTLFDYKCPYCGKPVTVTYDFDYTDHRNNVFIAYAESDDFYIDTLAELKSIKDEDESNYDGELYQTLRENKFRVTRNYIELAEKALIFDQGLDDRIIEIIKRIEMATLETKDDCPDDLIFNIGYYDNGSSGMVLMPVYNDEFSEIRSPFPIVSMNSLKTNSLILFPPMSTIISVSTANGSMNS